jgi:LuxR family transcriptional regulator, maltose regulon positive regulatory protein
VTSAVGRRAHQLPQVPDRAPGRPSFEILEAKLRPPTTRPGIVTRTALVGQLLAADAPLTAVIAPAGYGKTTLLAQWAESQQTAVAWVSADVGDNDPAVLCTYLAAAIDRIEPIGAGVFAALASHRPPVTLVARLLAALEALTRPIALAIDHLENITNVECLDVIGELAMRLPANARMVLCSRDNVGLPLARLRVGARLLEIGASDLALNREEAAVVLDSVGVTAATEDVDELVARTEGWPAGLYLAALGMRTTGPHRETALSLTGESRFLGDYLRAEVLDRASPQEVAFLTHTSILEQLSGSLCDATLDAVGSAARLQEIEGRNLLLVPLDGHRDWYRYHQLFRELLGAELQRREPQLVPELHGRAAAWFEANGRPEAALAHARAAGDSDQVARLLLDLVQPVWASGRADTVMGWLRWLADENLLDIYPALTVHGALMYALAGRPVEAEGWAEAAERALVLTDLPDGSSMDSLLAYLRAFLGRDGVAAMRADAVSSYRTLSPTSPYRASMLFTEGLSHLLDGDLDQADLVLAHAFDAATAIGAVPLAAMVLADRSAIAAEAERWTEATELGAQALELIGDESFDEYWTSAIVFAWGARLAIHSGELDAAQEYLARVARLRPLLTYALPAVSVQTLIEMARSYMALGDPPGAQAVLRQANDILQQRPDLGRLGPAVDGLRAQLDSSALASAGASSLTTAELRLLPFLATHLTLQEIGERLYVSRNTVKSQAISVYRKLGVSSRSEAITRLNELGLLVA